MKRYRPIQLLCVLVTIGLASSGVADAQPASPNPTMAKQHADRAKIAFQTSQWDTAVAELRKAYDYDPQAKYLYNIGLASEFAGKKQQALEAFRAYLAKDGSGKYAVTSKAKIAKLEHALSTERNKAAQAKIAARLRQARTYHQSGKHDAAAYEYLEAYKLTKNPEHLFEAAESYRRLAASAKAIRTYKQYLAADSTGKFAITARKHIRELEAADEPNETTTTPAITQTPETPTKTKTTPKKKSKWLWVAAGAALIVAGVAADTVPSSGSNGKFDATDVLPVGLYGVGIAGVVLGVF